MTEQGTDSATYVDWIRRTLADGLRDVDAAEQLRTIKSVHDALLRGGTMVLGCSIPPEHARGVSETLVSELAARIEELLGRGVDYPVPPPRHWRSFYERTRAQTAKTLKLLETLPSLDGTAPFVSAGSVPVGGLLGAGFSHETELLLVVSSAGRGVFDCTSGKRVGRDANDVTLPEYPNSATGIPPLPPAEIPIMGLDGGSPMSSETPDGIKLRMLSPDYNAIVWIELADTGSGYRLPTRFEEVRSAGFSGSGRSLIVAEQHTLHMFVRNPTA